MRRSVALMLDEFGRSTLRSEADRYGLAPPELIQHAVRHYLAERGAGRAAHRVPRFWRDDPARPAVPLILDLEGDVWARLDAEAADQGVSVERLLGHATLCLVADLDSGRVTERMLAAEPGMGPAAGPPG